ncbi:MAG: DNA polymerase II large subunit [Nitrososphaerota archaeon]
MRASTPLELSKYYEYITSRVKEEYELASRVRAETGSPVPVVEVSLPSDMAERVEVLVGPRGVASLIRDLLEKCDEDILPFRLAETLLKRYDRINDDALSQVLKVSLAVMTPPCITAAPTEGITGVKIKKNNDGSNYLAVYFAGPIRSAGGTEIAGAVVLADYIRRLAGISKYQPTDQEVRRYIEELRVYRRKVGRFQYNVPDEIVEFVLRRLPIEITGVATDPIPVPAYKDLPRVETPYLRGGALRVLNDGVIGRAKKVLKIVKVSGLDGWEWLEEVAAKLGEAKSTGKNTGLDDVVGGRPVLSSPGRFGGFRIRYGRAPTTSMAALGIHPYTMRLMENFVVAGTQLRIDYPGKGGIAVPVSSIEPPVVIFRDGSVMRIDNEEKLAEAERSEYKILFNGDILISFGDCVENNVKLQPPGYCEEWWIQEALLEESRKGRLSDEDRRWLEKIRRDPYRIIPPVEVACRISHKLGVPIHPRFMPFWDRISGREIERLRRWLASAIPKARKGWGMLILDYDPEAKSILEKMLIEHLVLDHKIALDLHWVKSLNFLFRPFIRVDVSESSVPELISSLSGTPFRPRMGSTVSARVGRPEKAGQRRMKPPVHVLFPVGMAGGPQRDIITAANTRSVVLELVRRVCLTCGEKTWMNRCKHCGKPTAMMAECPRCGAEYIEPEQEKCPRCGEELKRTWKQLVNLKELYENELMKAYEPPPRVLKGVRALTNKSKQPEELLKGILRANLGLYVYKDGTIRFDAVNAPLTHFTPSQIGVSPERLRELGYERDIFGQPLVSPHQICELRIQDIVVQRRMAEHLFNVSKFIDKYLKINGFDEYYKLQSVEDVVGIMVAVLSPHTYGAVACRVIGITDANVLYAHPLLHAAKRRDCDGDEDSVMLLLDVFINFSREYLPDRIGGAMDSPLLLTVKVYPEEVDEQAHNVDTAWIYPLEFYEAASRKEPASRLIGVIPIIKNYLNYPECYFGFAYTVPTEDLSTKPQSSVYKRLKTMLEKVEAQLRLAEKLAAVDEKRVAERVMASHILPDIMGNMRAFFSQSFRCKKCGVRVRRPPLNGKCYICGGDVVQTLYRGAIEKYVELASGLLERYIEDPYIREGALTAIENIYSVFKPRGDNLQGTRQATLKRFF